MGFPFLYGRGQLHRFTREAWFEYLNKYWGHPEWKCLRPIMDEITTEDLQSGRNPRQLMNLITTRRRADQRRRMAAAMAEQQMPKRYECPDYTHKPIEGENVLDGAKVTFKSLTPEEVNQEGTDMHHCVYLYAGHVAAGDYVVIHIEHSDVPYTAGYVQYGGKWVLSQCYGVCNAIPPEAVSKIANDLCDIVNEVHCLSESDPASEHNWQGYAVAALVGGYDPFADE
jgi:hypothetical protein